MTGVSEVIDLLADDPHPPPPVELVVVGCGNLLRGDDALGPMVIRSLWDRGVPDDVRLVDGGTAGMDVVFAVRNAERVIIVDAASTGNEPGTVYRLDADELVDLAPQPGLHSHSFRWDHAIGMARWMLGTHCPDDITVLLGEVSSVDPGAELSVPAQAALDRLVALVEEAYPAVEAVDTVTVEITDSGYLHLDAATARTCFPSDAFGAILSSDALRLMPLRASTAGGLLLKQRNVAGDRSALIRHVFDDAGRVAPCGRFPARWDEQRHCLEVFG